MNVENKRARQTEAYWQRWVLSLALALLYFVSQPAPGEAVQTDLQSEPTSQTPTTQEELSTYLSQQAETLSEYFDSEVHAAQSSVACDLESLQLLLDEGRQFIQLECADLATLRQMRELIWQQQQESEFHIIVQGKYLFPTDTGTPEEVAAAALERAGVLAPLVTNIVGQTSDPQVFEAMKTFFSDQVLASSDTVAQFSSEIFAGKQLLINNDLPPLYLPTHENAPYQSEALRQLMAQGQALFMGHLYHDLTLYSPSDSSLVIEKLTQTAEVFWQPKNTLDLPAGIFAWDTSSHGVLTTAQAVRGLAHYPDILFVHSSQLEAIQRLLPQLEAAKFVIITSQLGQFSSELSEFAKAIEALDAHKYLLFYALNNATTPPGTTERGSQFRRFPLNSEYLPTEKSYTEYPVAEPIAYVSEVRERNPSLYVDHISTEDYRAARRIGASIIAQSGEIPGVLTENDGCITVNGTSMATPLIAGSVSYLVAEGVVPANADAVRQYLNRPPARESVMADEITVLPDYTATQHSIELQSVPQIFPNWTAEMQQELQDSQAQITLKVPRVVETTETGHFWFYHADNSERPWDPAYAVEGMTHTVDAHFSWGSFIFLAGYLDVEVMYPDGTVVLHQVNATIIRQYLFEQGLTFTKHPGSLRFVSTKAAYTPYPDSPPVSNCSSEGPIPQVVDLSDDRVYQLYLPAVLGR